VKSVYLAGAYINEEHVRRAWARIRAGVRMELAAISVLPASRRINSVTRTAYESSLISILTLKTDLFTRAYQESRDGRDWRRVFRGRKAIFWPSIQERVELGLSDLTRHEISLNELFRGKPLKVRVIIDHNRKRVEEATVVSLNGHMARYEK
jgi:hypothetical protein